MRFITHDAPGHMRMHDGGLISNDMSCYPGYPVDSVELSQRDILELMRIIRHCGAEEGLGMLSSMLVFFSPITPDCTVYGEKMPPLRGITHYQIQFS